MDICATLGHKKHQNMVHALLESHFKQILGKTLPSMTLTWIKHILKIYEWMHFWPCWCFSASHLLFHLIYSLWQAIIWLVCSCENFQNVFVFFFEQMFSKMLLLRIFLFLSVKSRCLYYAWRIHKWHKCNISSFFSPTKHNWNNQQKECKKVWKTSPDLVWVYGLRNTLY